MKKAITFLFITSFLISSCKVDQSQNTINFDFNQYFDNIAKIDNCLNEGEAFQVLGQRVDVGIKAPLDTLNSPATLKALYYDTHKRQATAPPRASGRCVDIYIAVKERSLQKLGAINNEEAMNVVMEIYKDDQLPLEGTEAGGIIRVMLQFGEPILSRLEPIKDKRPRISSKVIQDIKNNTSY